MGNCARRYEFTEYSKMSDRADIDLLLNVYHWEGYDETEGSEPDSPDMLGTEGSDEDIEEAFESWPHENECYNVFDEIMQEHPEWFPKPEANYSEWDIIVVEYRQPWKDARQNQEEQICQKWSLGRDKTNLDKRVYLSKSRDRCG